MENQFGRGVLMTPDSNLFVETAKNYCQLIEKIENNNPNWLSEVNSLLPRLHAAIAAHGWLASDSSLPFDVDLEARFELFSKLHKILGEQDAYWMEFDVAHDDQHKSGSLADDLTDIYCELKHGLALLDAEQDQGSIFSNWRKGYRLHWGKHLVDAERHLYELTTQSQ